MRQMENSFEAEIETERETTIITELKGGRVYTEEFFRGRRLKRVKSPHNNKSCGKLYDVIQGFVSLCGPCIEY